MSNEMPWRAPLVRLTCIGNPDVNGGQPTSAYVTAENICQIRRLMASYQTYESSIKPSCEMEYHPGVECTEVNCGQYSLLVTEQPERVADLRNAALGIEPPKFRVV